MNRCQPEEAALRIVCCIVCLQLLATTTLEAQEKPLTVSLERLVDLRSLDKADSRLAITLKIKGDQVSSALEYGDVRINEPEPRTGTISGADEEGFAPLKRSGFGDKLGEALLAFELPSPPRNQMSFTILAGTLKLRSYRQQLIPIEKIQTKLNQTIQDPLLKAHGIELRVVDPRQAFPGVTEETELARLKSSVVALEISGNTRKIRDFVLETPEGKEVLSRAGSFGAGRTLILSRRSEEPLPENVIAKVLIPVSPEVVPVSFRLEKVELP